MSLDLISHYVPYKPGISFAKREEQSVLTGTEIDGKISVVINATIIKNLYKTAVHYML